MDLRLQIHHCDRAGTWSINGLPRQAVARFDHLAEGLEYAKRECASAPAVIELFIDGLYAVVYQERGWPHQLCRPAGCRRAGIGGTARPSSGATFSQICDRLRRIPASLDLWHLVSFYRRASKS